ncbi:hypothetical protein [Paenibacillus tarimensis]|uniref:hypothetical protein n=1 Tax=Paenibacillus tarimensis TaxID=416012 RepID=UPI001F3D0D07|nr:hypothetical protein [Paenibacillus tarimensis]MCF2944753.1 hypothetical protein [Paenibacillus tarimensis]
MGILYDIVNQKKVRQGLENSKVSKPVIRTGSTSALKGEGGTSVRQKEVFDVLVK